MAESYSGRWLERTLPSPIWRRERPRSGWFPARATGGTGRSANRRSIDECIKSLATSTPPASTCSCRCAPASSPASHCAHRSSSRGALSITSCRAFPIARNGSKRDRRGRRGRRLCRRAHGQSRRRRYLHIPVRTIVDAKRHDGAHRACDHHHVRSRPGIVPSLRQRSRIFTNCTGPRQY